MQRPSRRARASSLYIILVTANLLGCDMAQDVVSDLDELVHVVEQIRQTAEAESHLWRNESAEYRELIDKHATELPQEIRKALLDTVRESNRQAKGFSHYLDAKLRNYLKATVTAMKRTQEQIDAGEEVSAMENILREVIRSANEIDPFVSDANVDALVFDYSPEAGFAAEDGGETGVRFNGFALQRDVSQYSIEIVGEDWRATPLLHVDKMIHVQNDYALLLADLRSLVPHLIKGDRLFKLTWNGTLLYQLPIEIRSVEAATGGKGTGGRQEQQIVKRFHVTVLTTRDDKDEDDWIDVRLFRNDKLVMHYPQFGKGCSWPDGHKAEFDAIWGLNAEQEREEEVRGTWRITIDINGDDDRCWDGQVMVEVLGDGPEGFQVYQSPPSEEFCFEDDLLNDPRRLQNQCFYWFQWKLLLEEADR